MQEIPLRAVWVLFNSLRILRSILKSILVLFIIMLETKEIYSFYKVVLIFLESKKRLLEKRERRVSYPVTAISPALCQQRGSSPKKFPIAEAAPLHPPHANLYLQ